MIDVERALAAWSEERTDGASEVRGVPTHELTRSPAARRVGEVAAAEGLRLYAFEHRVTLPLPDPWIADGAEVDSPEWVDGVLPEPKYASFRHDLGVGSFHPGHRAKWSTHELCHGLVGTAWAPGASPLFHATAGRLAELVPVVLWYFLDEIRLGRCPRHSCPLFRTFCPDCEAAAARGPAPFDEARARRLLGDAVRFVDDELAAVRRTLAEGVPVPHVHGSLDLCSDGVAYAVAHGPRLGSAGHAAWAERYLPPRMGGHPTLAALEDRVVEVFAGICHGGLAARPVAAADWVAQDLAARVLQGTGGDAGACAEIWDALDRGDVTGAFELYAERADDGGWLHPLDVFAAGYELPVDGGGCALDQLEEGLRSVVPMTLQLADDAGLDLVGPFARADAPARVPLGLRFAQWLEGWAAPHVVGLCRFEAALRATSADAEALALGSGEGSRWARGSRQWVGGFDPVAWAEAVDAGEVEGRDEGGRLTADPPDEEPTWLVMGRDGAGELVLASVPPEEEGLAPDDLEPDTVEALRELGLIVPARWSISA